MKMTKVKNTMVQDQDQRPAHGLAQSPVPGHILDLAQDPIHDPVLARGQAQGADQGQEVGAVHASIVPHLVVGHVPVLGKRKDLTHDPDLGLVVHITTDIEGSYKKKIQFINSCNGRELMQQPYQW